jgi:hypothetical protein
MDGAAPGETSRARAGFAAGARDRAPEGGVDKAELLRAVIAGAGTVGLGEAGWTFLSTEIFPVLLEPNPESTEIVFGMRSS